MKKINSKKQKTELNTKDEFDISSYHLDELKDPKWFDVFNKLALCFGGCSLIVTLLILINVPIIFIPIIAILPAPAIYLGTTKLKEKMDNEVLRDIQMMNQFPRLFIESFEKDHKITKSSVCFYNEIENNQTLKKLTPQTKTNINQFLYMINANYYDEIHMEHDSLTREDVILRIISQIEAFFIENPSNSLFATKEAKQIISNCFFINDTLKKEIKKEFKESERKLFGEKMYHILDRNIDTNVSFEEEISKMHQELNSKEHLLRTFDVNNIEWYEFLLKCFDQVEPSVKEYGEFTSVEWDFYALRDIMSFMLTNFNKELESVKGELYNSRVVIDFMYNAFVYTVLNKKEKVGIEEMINTFKNWNFFENLFDLKLRVLDGIFEEFKIDYALHPYRQKRQKGNKTVAIRFPNSEN